MISGAGDFIIRLLRVTLLRWMKTTKRWMLAGPIALGLFGWYALASRLGERAPTDTDLIVGPWQVTELARQSEVPLILISFTPNELSVNSPCGSARTGWTQDTDGLAVSFGDLTFASESCREDERGKVAEFAKALSDVDEWVLRGSTISLQSSTNSAAQIEFTRHGE